MSEFWRRRVIDQLERGESLEQIDRDLVQIRSISDEERAALWLLAWGEQQRRTPAQAGSAQAQMSTPSARGTRRSDRSSGEDPITAALELARAETEMDVAVLGEVYDGREVVRFVAGDGSFGLAPGASMPIEDTYCQRLLTGRLSNVVPDAHATISCGTFRSRVSLGSVPTSAFRSRRSTRASTCSAVSHTSSGHN